MRTTTAAPARTAQPRTRKRASTTPTEAPEAPPVPEPAAPTASRSLLRPLGIVGYDHLEPALLAALATEEPLLLISEHGAAKTLLLLRLAEAMGLELRHYNASILQFDDLAGFPIPDEQGSIRYAAPPGAIWDAEVAFFDEIGRCRPDVANKLFPLIHERRMQGVAIERLRYRWAATNPPEASRDSTSRFAYDGVDTLDAALADRFAYIVALPHFGELSDADRAAIIRGSGDRPDAAAHSVVRELVATTAALIPGIRAGAGESIAVYVDVLIAKLSAAGIAVGGRRAATMYRNMIAMRAAHLALGLPGDARACRAALLVSMPESVRSVIPRSKLHAAHQAAWQQTALADDDPLRVLLAVRDPVQRALLALSLPRLDMLARSDALCTALAELAPVDRLVLAWFVLPYLFERPIVSLSAMETVATLVQEIATTGVKVTGYAPHRAWAVSLRSELSKTALASQDAEFVHGVLAQYVTPAPQMTGTDLPQPHALITRILALRDACVAALGVSLWTT